MAVMLTKYFPYLIIFAGVLATGYILWYLQSNSTIFASMTANDEATSMVLESVDAMLME